jgi:hypothetical protein
VPFRDFLPNGPSILTKRQPFAEYQRVIFHLDTQTENPRVGQKTPVLLTFSLLQRNRNTPDQEPTSAVFHVVMFAPIPARARKQRCLVRQWNLLSFQNPGSYVGMSDDYQ